MIADGRQRDVLERIVAGEDVGTYVPGSPRRLSSRKHWIASSLKPRGSIRVDGGAVRALRNPGRSLLPIGVLDVEGRFSSGDLVTCITERGEEIARGLEGRRERIPMIVQEPDGTIARKVVRP